MASINSLMSSSSSSSSSIYGNSNIISGLASGMDTEAMIENAVSGIKNKLTGFQQDMTKLEWEQTAYRSIIDKLVNFSSKYLSFSSNTNLLSASFFDSATKTTTGGTYSKFVSASGTTLSDFEILQAKKGTAATYAGMGNFTLAEGTTFSTNLTMADLGLMSDGETSTMTLGDKSMNVSATDTVQSVLNRMGKELGIDATYSETTGKFYLKSKDTGVEGNFSELFDANLGGDLAGKLFGTDGTYTKGENSYLLLNINGESKAIDNQGGNTFDIDGMKITISGDFTVDTSAGESAVTFETKTDSDKIVNAIKSMVEDFNAMANEIKDAYTTKPLTKSNGKRYEPLTEKDQEDMSDEAIKRYEEKAKTGLLFADSNLSSLYNELRSAISGLDLEKLGITTAYSSGKTTLVIDEEKLRGVVETDLDTVKEVLTKEADTTTKDAGGVMTKLQTTLDKYAKTTGATKGILISLAGSDKAVTSLNDNTYKSKMDRLQEQIDRWQDKLSDKVDYYTRQFTALEKLISEMNSQSSAIYGMMGY